MPDNFVADGFCVILDANVLYPNRMRDILLTMVHKGLFRAMWTDEIMDEWSRNVLANHAASEAQIRRTLAVMRDAFEECWVYHHRPLIAGMEGLPDEGDRHVVAAALAAGAQQIVTSNLKDFPAEVLESYELEAIDPDTFLVGQFELNRSLAVNAVRSVRQRLDKPSFTKSEFLTDLTRKGMPKFAAALKPFFEDL
ncbi:PIN domain-containing protein [Stappia sp. F7233]|uniref:PIN domain-containing protein n=1 Tax=Stappia albiluteola TaxID=2758565 RepID=A0A839AH61_9HYPH|nr:PIN domain-containing protein [Stappia albiluteola]MBA5778475.1 PIN domain-containing protein [Stappia albiluteola]